MVLAKSQNIIALSIYSIYILMKGPLEHIAIANVPAQAPTSSASWGQEHLARILNVFLDTNCITHKQLASHVMTM
jgi:hypothetical protein